uniref:ShTK domain protein n=1 Tax=Angiostrongylus cantonensis TaxID=6313 RepID=A0A0K0DRJ7_ANGCA
LKDLAISTCPKHCGYCCETPEYKCDNKLLPRVKCETVTPFQCTDPKWRAILAEDCPKTCGLCLSGGCVDKVAACVNDPSICRQIDMQVFVKENCQRTCGFCSTMSRSHYSCAAWALNGFCTSNYYSVALRRQYCPKTCNLC